MDGINSKRRGDEETEKALILKKPKTDLIVADGGGSSASKALISMGVTRTSKLQAPIMLLSGHQAEVLALKFHPSGDTLASGSVDKCIRVWKVYGECENDIILKGHRNAILDLQWSQDGSEIITASADRTGGIWDVRTETRVKKLAEHGSIVNSVSVIRRGPQLLLTGSDDGTVKLWDPRTRGASQTFANKFQVTSVAFSDNGEQFFSAGLDNEIKVWDMRTNDIVTKLSGHTGTVTGISLSNDGSYLASNSMDNTLRVWDVRPFFTGETRCIKYFHGIQHNFERNLLRCAWSTDGSKISAGSSDRFVYVWDTTTRKMLYMLPGHAGTVNAVEFHPKEPIIGSASSDKTIYLGEIEP